MYNDDMQTVWDNTTCILYIQIVYLFEYHHNVKGYLHKLTNFSTLFFIFKFKFKFM